MKKYYNVKHILILTLTVIISSACSSDFMLRSMYADLGDSFADDVHHYANFDRQQSQAIEQVASKLHSWHRTTQLPIYSQFLRDIANDSASGLLLQRENIEQKLQRMEHAMQTLENAPWPMLGDLFSSLSLDQIAQIEETLAEEIDDAKRAANRAQTSRGMKKLQREQQAEIESMFSEVLDVSLNKAQKRRIQTMLEEWSNDMSLEIQLESQWNSEFIELLRRLHAGSVTTETLQNHFLANSTLLENAAPEQAEQDREILIDGVHDIIRSMNNVQHQRMRASLNRYADLIDTL